MRVTTVAEARLSAMALFLDVARGSPAVAERRAWLEPFWAADAFTAYIGRGLLAEHALWRGDYPTALAEVAATLACWGGTRQGLRAAGDPGRRHRPGRAGRPGPAGPRGR